MSAAEDAARIAEACVVQLGDVLVLSLDRQVTRMEFDSIKDSLAMALPPTVRFVIVDGSFHLYVIRASEAAS